MVSSFFYGNIIGCCSLCSLSLLDTGYTSATFSGRCAMPLLADTIVECGRKTLRKAINLANKWGRENPKWIGSRVIYGDTDSLFVHLPGRSHLEAFEFGEQLCKAVTADNPPPVELKLEKVYTGSIMQTASKLVPQLENLKNKLSCDMLLYCR